jgi:hypothetical protein
MDTKKSSDSIESNKYKSNNKIIKNKNLLSNNNVDHVPLIYIDNIKLWLDKKIIPNKYFFDSTNLYLSNYNKINLYYNTTDYEIKQKNYYYDLDKLNIYSHPNSNIQKEHNNNAIIYVGINNNTRRFFLDNIFRELIDICVRDNIRDPITGDYLINKNIRTNFYNWAKKNS